MALSAGTTLGTYEILGLLGAGGMGEVYRATDTKLGRAVAIKVLRPEVAGDAERLARFRREASLLASLNHPNVAAIYGLEEADGQPFLVLELVEGEDLAQRLSRGPLPLEEAVEVARQVTEALDAAHSKGIVHRDLKPANVKRTPEGQVKVLDFGLAKAWEEHPPPGSSGELSQSPTLAHSGTLAGVILGTAAYMSPEQARGRAVDRRTDVWAFGALVYEMLTGQRAFQGEDVSDTLAAVLRSEPDFGRLPRETPPALRRVLELCLTRDPRRRVHDIADVRLAMEGAFAVATGIGRAATKPRTPWAAAALASLATGLAVWALAGRTPPRPRELVRFADVLPAGHELGNRSRPRLAVSPDGRRFAYLTAEGVYVRSMDQLEARLLPGTDGRVRSIFFSADGGSIAFQDGGELRRLDLAGGAAVAICPVTRLLGAHWAADDTILFADSRGILSVPAAGGKPRLVVEAGEGELLDAPQLLPGGSAVLFSVGRGSGDAGDASGTAWEDAHLAVAPLASGERTLVLKGGSDGRYVAPGYIVYAADDGLSAVAFDASSLRVTSGPVSMLEGVSRSLSAASANYAVTDDGTLFYFAAGQELVAPLAWVGRDGVAETIDSLPPRSYSWPRLSPDGERLVAMVGGDAWIYDLASGRQLRLTEDGATDYVGWTPSGQEVIYTSARGGVPGEVWIQAADGGAPARQLTSFGGRVDFDDWAPDGRTFSAHHHFGAAINQLMVSFDGESARPETWLEHDHNDAHATFSPDGRYVALVSRQTGRDEIFIRPYPGPGGQTPVSIGGGTEPAWAENGELFYRRGSDYTLMAVRVSTDPVLTLGPPVELFSGIPPPPFSSPTRRYDVTPDGRRFVMSRSVLADTASLGAREPARVVVVQGWVEELRRRLSGA